MSLNILECSETRYRMLQNMFQEVLESLRNVLDQEIVDTNAASLIELLL